MKYEILANATAILHLTIIVAVLVGLLISFRHKRFRPWEAAALIAIVLLWSYYGNCPLTILEEHFRTLAGKPSGITNIGFLPYYADKLFNFEISSRIVQRSTFFTGGVFFASSIEWLSPFFHKEVFKLRRIFKRNKKSKRISRRS